MAVKGTDPVLEALERSESALRNAAGDLERTRAAIGESSTTTLRALADRSGVSEGAIVAFAETVGELLDQRPLSVEAARRAALLAVAGEVWEDELGPLLSSAQVRVLLGGVSRQRIDELLRSRRLVGLLDGAGRRRFPAFQFSDGRALGPLVAAFWTVADGAVSDWTAASWCVAADAALGGRSPMEWVREGRDPDRLARVAQQQGARWAQ